MTGMTANTPRNRAKVKESWPIPQSVGRLPISRLPFSHRANHAATAKHRNVDTNTRTIPSSRGREDIAAKYTAPPPRTVLRFAVPSILPEDSRSGINKFVEDKRVSSV